MNIEKIEKGIERTGFRLEFDMSRILTGNGWKAINNKYYVDDQQESVREIDIVAYKAFQVRGVYVYTVLILSCKKNDKDAWALLSKASDHSDPNIEWVPVHAWSNDRVLKFMLDEQDWKSEYLSVLELNGCDLVSRKPENHIFGFQEMSKENGSPQNDKNIFNSITSLMKAQAYEMNALPLRKRDPCAFQFNLVSIANTDLVRLDFESSSVKGVLVDEEIYVAGYIIDKQQTFARVHFIRSDKFHSIIKNYNNLHESNKRAFGFIYDKFFKEIFNDNEKLNLFKDDIAKDIWWPVYKKFNHLTGLHKIFSDGWMCWDKKNSVIEFQVDLGSEYVSELNSDSEIRDDLSKLIKKYCKYEGESKFSVNDIPF